MKFLHRQDCILLFNWLFFLERALHFVTKLKYSVKRESVGNTLLLPRAKMLFVAMIFVLCRVAKNVLFRVTIISFCIHNSLHVYLFLNLWSVVTHAAIIYANLLEQKKVFA